MVRVEVPEPPEERVMITGVNEVNGPDGEIDADRVMSPARV